MLRLRCAPLSMTRWSSIPTGHAEQSEASQTTSTVGYLASRLPGHLHRDDVQSVVLLVPHRRSVMAQQAKRQFSLVEGFGLFV